MQLVSNVYSIKDQCEIQCDEEETNHFVYDLTFLRLLSVATDSSYVETTTQNYENS